MAVETHWYGVPVRNLLDGTAVWDWNTDTIKVALTTSAYTPDQDAHDFFNDVTNEISGTGYTAGGETIDTPTVTYDSGTNEIRLDCSDPAWSSASFTARYGVAYKDTGTPSNSPLIGYLNFESDRTVSSGTFTIQLNASGMFKAVVS